MEAPWSEHGAPLREQSRLPALATPGLHDLRAARFTSYETVGAARAPWGGRPGRLLQVVSVSAAPTSKPEGRRLPRSQTEAHLSAADRIRGFRGRGIPVAAPLVFGGEEGHRELAGQRVHVLAAVRGQVAPCWARSAGSGGLGSVRCN